MRILLVAGGTGGHIYPALTIARALKKEKNADVLFVGAPDSMEEKIITGEGLPFKKVPASGFPRKLSLRLLEFFWKNSLALFRAYKIIKDFKPEIVIGTGGFVSGPTLFIASLLKIPTLIHEQNLIPGITNRLLASRVEIIAVSYKRTRDFLSGARKVIVTGNPVRPEVISLSKKEGRDKLKIDKGKKVVLVFGGSQGARSINQAMLDLYERVKKVPWCSRVTFIHITGEKDFQGIKQKIMPENKLDIRLYPFLKEMPYALACADLAICRAGAMTLAELTARGVPAILIPYPLATDNHQEKNARELEELGAALMILDRYLNGEKLFQDLSKLLFEDQKLSKMAQKSKQIGRPEALEMLLGLIDELN